MFLMGSKRRRNKSRSLVSPDNKKQKNIVIEIEDFDIKTVIGAIQPESQKESDTESLASFASAVDLDLDDSNSTVLNMSQLHSALSSVDPDPGHSVDLSQSVSGAGAPIAHMPVSNMGQIVYHGIGINPMESHYSPTTYTPPPHVMTHGAPPASQVSLTDSDIKRIAEQLMVLIKPTIEAAVSASTAEALKQSVEKIQQLQEENSQIKKEVERLSLEIDHLEQWGRRWAVRINGIETVNEPGSIGEPENTDLHVLELAKKLKVELTQSDIDRSHRVGRQQQGKPRAIIVKFTNYAARRRFISARSKLKTVSPGVYINEDLTKMRSDIAYKCRQLVKDGKLKKSWTYDGNVFIVDNTDTKKSVIKLSDLQMYGSG